MAGDHYTVDSLSPKDYRALNGVYNNEADTTFGYHYSFNDNHDLELLDHFFRHIPLKARWYNDSIIPQSEKRVILEALNPKKILVSLYQQDRFIYAKAIKGRYKKGYFYVRGKNIIYPLPILFGYHFQKARIGKTGTDLLIDYRRKFWVFAVVAGGAAKDKTSSLFSSRQ